ncbi:polyprenyl synthetase family protein [bacterium]|nr:polyprenyl synthetase family protein [bacterium]
MTDTHQPLKDRIETLAARFEDELRAYVAASSAEPVANLHEAMTYALGTDIENPALRGKRIRPVLCLLTAESLGAPLEAAMPFALSIELMHNFALVHDDMEDGDIMRRGRDAAWVKYGPAHAINIGDYLLVHTTRALTDWGPSSLSVASRFELLKLIASALDHTHVGQALDMNARQSRSITIEDYLRIVREKTGYYLAAPIQGGAIVAGADSGLLDGIGRMAQFLGPMFQIIDDIIDLTQGKGREAIGSDIREGKRSYLVAYTAEKCSRDEAKRLFEILDTPRAETTQEMIEEVTALFDRYSSIEAGRAYCNDLYAESTKILSAFPPALAAPLGELFEMLVHRSH